jgi:hypothetical protein
LEEDGFGSGFFPVVGFGSNVVEPLESATTMLFITKSYNHREQQLLSQEMQLKILN